MRWSYECRRVLPVRAPALARTRRECRSCSECPAPCSAGSRTVRSRPGRPPARRPVPPGRRPCGALRGRVPHRCPGSGSRGRPKAGPAAGRAFRRGAADQAPFLFGDESRRGNVTACRPQAIGEILLFAVGDLRRAESLLGEAVNRRKLLRPFGTYRHDLRFLRFLTSYFSDAYAAPAIGVGMGSRRQTAAAR